MRTLALFLLPLVAFADVMITPAVMVDLHLAASADSPIVAQVDYSDTLNGTPAGEPVDGQQWFSMPYTASMEAYVDSSDVAKSLDLNTGALLYDTIEKTNILFMLDDPAQAKLLDMERGMGHVQFEGELTVYFARQVAANTNTEEATLDEFADVMEAEPLTDEAEEPETTIVELSTVEDVDFISDRTTALTPTVGRASAMRSIEGRLVFKDTLFGKKAYLGDSRTGKKIAKISKKSPVGLVNLERYADKVVVLVGTIDDSSKGISITVRNVRLR